MIKLNLPLIALMVLMINMSAYASNSNVAFCHVDGKLKQFFCLNNMFWKMPLWVDSDKSEITLNTLSTLCAKDTGPVFNSTKTLQEECGGNPIQYSYW